MRLLCTFAGGEGHLQPLLPLARSAAAAGHAVTVTGARSLAPTAAAAGLRFVPSGPDVTPQRRDLQPVDLDDEYLIVGEHFAGRLARTRADDLLALCRASRPDVIVRDEMDFGAAVVAERLGIAQASVIVIAAGGFIRPEIVTEPLHALRAEHGLPPDPHLTMLTRDLVLAPVPRSFRDPADPLPAGTMLLRTGIEPRGGAGPAGTEASVRPAWRTGRPVLYVTLGTIFNTESGDLFARVLAGLQRVETPVEVVVTVGRGMDPAQLGPQPGHVHVERYVAQSRVLPHCAAVLNHAGSGSVLGALAHGLPLVCIPLGADQPLNAARCVALGVGRELEAATLLPDDVAAAVSAVLTAARYREAAVRIQAEIAAMPSPEEVLTALERLPARANGVGRG